MMEIVKNDVEETVNQSEGVTVSNVEVKEKKKDPVGIYINDPNLGGWLIKKEYGQFLVYHPDRKNSLTKFNNLNQCLQHTVEMLIQDINGTFTLPEYQMEIKRIHDTIMGLINPQVIQQ